MKTEDLVKKYPNKQKTIKDLSFYIKNRSDKRANYSLLLGAGASVSSGIRSGGNLVEAWKKELYLASNPVGTSYTAEKANKWLDEEKFDWYQPEKEYASFFQKKFDLPAQRRVFIEGEVRDSKPSLGYAFLTQLVNENYFNTVFTTNFDDLINEAFYRFGQTRPLVCSHDSSIKEVLITAVRPKIIKLHGDYLFNNIKCDIDETSRLEENVQEKFEQFLREYGLIVVGYSGSDDSIMDVLEGLIGEDKYLMNGLYWCLKEDSYISPQLEKLMERNRTYYVVIDGFDEMFADLSHDVIGKDLELDGLHSYSSTSDLVEYWLESSDYYSSSSTIIQSELQKLTELNSKGVLSRALITLMSQDLSQQPNLDQLDDDETVELIKVETLKKQHKYKEVVEYVENLIKRVDKKEFKINLLVTHYEASRHLGDINKCISSCSSLIDLDEKNPITYLKWFDVESDIDKKEWIIAKAIEKDRYFWKTYYVYSIFLLEKLSLGIYSDKSSLIKSITENLNYSLDRNPRIGNPAWVTTVNHIISNYPASEKEKNIDQIKEIVDILKKQDYYSPVIAEIMYCACKYADKLDVFDDTIFDFLWDSMAKFGRGYDEDTFKFIISSSIEFGNHDFAYKAFEEYKKNAEISCLNDTAYILSVATMYLDIHSDLDEAICFLRDAMTKNEDPRIADRMITYFLYKKDTESANAVMDRFSYLFSVESFIQHKAKIYTCEGEYDLAIKEYEKLRSLPFFEEKHTQQLSYTYLKQGDFQKAIQVSDRLLNKHSWDRDQLAPLIINHEFATKEIKGKVNKARLAALVNGPGSKEVKAMAYLLMGDEQKSLELMVEMVKKEYSWLYQFESWPVAQSIIPRLNRELGFNSTQLKVVER